MKLIGKKGEWETYEKGEVVAGVHILGIAVLSPYKTQLTYDVLFLCCKKEAQMTHRCITKRINQEQTLCIDCGRAVGKKPVEGEPVQLHLPLWPVPGEV